MVAGGPLVGKRDLEDLPCLSALYTGFTVAKTLETLMIEVGAVVLLVQLSKLTSRVLELYFLLVRDANLSNLRHSIEPSSVATGKPLTFGTSIAKRLSSFQGFENVLWDIIKCPLYEVFSEGPLWRFHCITAKRHSDCSN